MRKKTGQGEKKNVRGRIRNKDKRKRRGKNVLEK